MTHLLHLARLRLAHLIVVPVGLRMALRSLVAALGMPVAIGGHFGLRLVAVAVLRLSPGAHAHLRMAASVCLLGMSVAVRLLPVPATIGLGMAAAVRLLRMTTAVAVSATVSARLCSGRGSDCKRGNSGRENEFRHNELLRFNASTKRRRGAFLRQNALRRHAQAI